MINIDIPKLPDFDKLKELLPIERKTIIKVNGFSQEDDYVRSIDDAVLILEFLSDIQPMLRLFFKKNHSLLTIFKKDFGLFSEFVDRNTVLDLCFLDDCLFPEKELLLFGQDGGISNSILLLHKKSLEDWCHETENNHIKSQLMIKDEFHLELKTENLDCKCVGCIADFRSRTREFIFDECKTIVEDTRLEIEENLDKHIDSLNHIYLQMQKKLDSKFHKVRQLLKRATLNRMENQIKGIIKESFNYPSEIAVKHSEKLIPHLKGYLVQEGLTDDFVTHLEYERFFIQISSNIWKPEQYITREFKKLVKSVTLLKRKDISSTILNKYLGEFWTHSLARDMKRKIIYHMGPTNSGKTYHAINALAEAGKGCYLAPLRLLAGELYDTLNQKDVPTSLLTGEEVIDVENATHYSSTIEMARLNEVFDCCVIDEIQMITDKQRGWAWTRALVNIIATEVHICGDPSVLELVRTIVELCGDELIIKEYSRMTELIVEQKPLNLGELEKSDALIVFSRRNALRYKSDLERLGFKVSIVYGRLSPEVRREQARKFDNEETDIIVSTDAIAMGMNLPIKRIVFSTIVKYINSKEFQISDSEIKQIAGRAGRYLRFPIGYVNCLKKVDEGYFHVNEAITTTLNQKTNCMVGPDLDIFAQVNNALNANNLPELKLSEFLRLFDTMSFQRPFYCVELTEMIEVAEMVEEADIDSILTNSEIFGFSCAPVNLGLVEHVQFFVYILGRYVASQDILNEPINHQSDDIDYLETSIKCTELFQWLSRHFDNKNFLYDESELLENKMKAVEKLNVMLSDKIVEKCSSCGGKLEEDTKFRICEACFKQRRYSRPKRSAAQNKSRSKNKSSDPQKSGDHKKSSARRKRKR
jgi:ATP-dependent RNA helicase SUPV3L1/SUV3